MIKVNSSFDSVLDQFRVLLHNVLDQLVNVRADLKDLVVEALDLGIASHSLKLDDLVHLVQAGLDPPFSHHLGDNALSLVMIDLQEPPQLLESDVLVDL